jgi:hypothetical protein
MTGKLSVLLNNAACLSILNINIVLIKYFVQNIFQEKGCK